MKQHNLSHRLLALISLLLVCVMLFASCAPTINEVVGTSKATESTDHDHTEHESDTDHNHSHGGETDHVHQWSDWVVTKKATCTEDGEETKSCPCGEVAIKIVDALGHDYISVTTAPTCTEQGYTTHTCAVCKDSYIDNYINADGHDYNVVVTDPTCIEKGYTTYTCECGDSYIDNYVNATGHTFGDWTTTKDATCTEKGEKKRECACGEVETEAIPATGHSYKSVVTKPTCTAKGYTTYTCSCGDSYVDNYVSATGHSFGDWKTTKEATCTEKGEQKRECACGVYETKVIPATDHSYKSVVTEPTCEDKGYTTYTCHCGDSYIDNYVSTTGHSFGNWETTKAATCTEQGEQKRTCACGEFETKAIPATDHSYTAVVTEPTCEDKGYTTYTCHCGDSYIDDYVNANGHSYKSVITAPTCTERGYTTHTCHCGDSYTDTYVDAKGHKDDGTGVCSVCGSECDHFHTFTFKTATDTYLASEATCTAPAKYYYSCTCGEAGTDTFDSGDALGHTYTSVVTDPTCTEDGYTAHTCHCGYSYVSDEVDALGHDKINHNAKAPTCTEIGWNAYVTCSRCNYTTYEELKALDHNEIDHNAKAPTCTEIGWNAYVTCSRCDYTTYEELDALGHDFYTQVTPQTCTTNGYSYNRCSNCDYETMKVIYATGHVITDYYTYDEPTCTIDGSYSGYCDNCDEYIEEMLKATGHTTTEFHFADDYCGNQKLGYILCVDCETVIAEFGHTYRETIITATCSVDGKKVYTCDNCGDSYEIAIPASGHIAGEWTVITPVGCTTEGTNGRYCVTCEELIESITISAIGHSYESAAVTGGVRYTCTHCNGSYFVEAIEYITLTFICDGEKICKDLQIVKGSSPTLPLPSRDNYYFDGWYLNEDLNNRCLDTYKFTVDTTLYATWMEDGISGEMNTNNLFTDVSTNFTFTITSEISLTNDNLSSYVFVTDINQESPAIHIVSKSNGVYTIGSNNYEPRMTYQVLLRDGLEFTDISGRNMWFVIEGEDVCNIQFKEGVIFIPEVTVYDYYESADKTYLILPKDELNKGDNVVIFQDTKYDVAAILEIISEMPFGNLYLYQVNQAEIENVFETFEFYSSGDLHVDDFELDSEATEELTQQLMSSATYARFERAAVMMRGVEIGDYYYDFNGFDGPKFTSECKNGKITIKATLTANFARMHVDTRKVDSTFSITLEFENVLAFSENSYVEYPGWRFWEPIRFSFVAGVSNNTKINLYASINDKKNCTTELAHFKKIFEDAKNTGEFPVTDSSGASNEKVITLGSFTIPVGPLSFRIALNNLFNFEAVGKLGIGIEANIGIKIGAKGDTHGNFEAIKYYSAYASVDFYMLGKISVSDKLQVEISLSLWGILGVNAKASAGPYFEMGGIVSAHFDTKGNSSTTASGYIELGIAVDAKIGIVVLSWKPSWTLYDEKFPIFSLGEKVVPLYFEEPRESLNHSLTCGQSVNISELIDTSAVVQNFDNMKKETKDLTCNYYLNGSYPDVNLSTDGNLQVNGDMQGFVISIKVAHGDIYKLVELTISVSHNNVTSAYVAPTCTTPGNTEYVFCSTCYKIFEGENTVIDALGHNYEAALTAPTCTEKGYTTHTCSVCSDSYVDSYIDETGHIYEAWYTDIAATCLANGTERHDCVRCNHYETRVVNATGHSYESVVTVPTCIMQGYTTHSCSFCDEAYVDSYVPMTAHIDANGNDECDVCDVLFGLYDANDNLIASWDELVNTYGMVATNNYTSSTYKTDTASPYYVLTKNEALTSGTKLLVGNIEAIGDYAFADCTKLTIIMLPSGVTSIGDQAFYICSTLTNITLPDGLTSIGDSAFSTCKNLTSIVIPDSVTSIDHRAFYFCNKLTDVYIQDLVAWLNISFGGEIVSNTFYNFYLNGVRITDLVIPEGVTKINDYAFNHNSSLTTVTIPDTVTTIGNYAFYDCRSLVSVDLGNGVTSIGNRSFAYCSSLSRIIIPSSVTSIGTFAFNHCDSLASVTIENGVKIVGDDAFMDCDSLTSITIPDSVISIGEQAFRDCDSLTSVTIGNGVESIGAMAFIYNCNLLSVTIGKSVTYIGSGAFRHCYKLVEVYNLSSLTITAGTITYGYAGYYALDVYTSTSETTKIWRDKDGFIFYGDACLLLGYIGSTTEITLPSSCNGKSYALSSAAFYNCSTLTKIIIPNSVTSIGDCSFYGCESLVSISIPNSVTKIGEEAFRRCYSLTSVTLSDTITSISDYAFCGCENLVSISIPNSVTSIGDYAFDSCEAVTKVTIGTGVLSIGVGAFRDCRSLTNIIIPSNVESIGGVAFSYCFNLANVTFSNGLKQIGNGAFYECRKLMSITIPDSVTSIGSGAFEGCDNLTYVTFGTGLTSVGDYAFSGCDRLNIVIPAGVTFGEYVFMWSNLTSVTISNGVTTIYYSSFYGCPKLTSIRISRSVTIIEDDAFMDCNNLTSIIFDGTVEEWSSITFGNRWNENVPATEVICTDGTVALS